MKGEDCRTVDGEVGRLELGVGAREYAPRRLMAPNTPSLLTPTILRSRENRAWESHSFEGEGVAYEDVVCICILFTSTPIINVPLHSKCLNFFFVDWVFEGPSAVLE